MGITVQIDSKDIVKDLQNAAGPLHRSLVIGLWLAARAIQREARIIHRYITRTGALDRSIGAQVNREELAGEVFLDTGIAKYAPYQHDGTGIYGKRKRRIKSRNKKTSFFQGIFRKSSKGIRADPFIDIAAKNKLNDVIEILTKSLGIGLVKAKLK